MRFSFKTAQQQTSWPNIVEFWREGDSIEVFDAGWAFDHFYPLGTAPTEPCLEGWTTLAGLARETQRVRMGLMVASNTYRHPAVHANIAATLDHISGGRLEFGFGAGWFEDEHEAYGIELPDLSERFDRFDEAIEVIDSLLTRPETTFAGEHYRLDAARCEPKPLQSPRPPIVIGGKGEKRTLRTAARWADQWNYPGYDPEDFRRKNAVLEDWCSQLGRDATAIERSIQVRFAGDPAELEDHVGRCLEVGVDHVIVYFPPPHDPGLLEPAAAVLRQFT